MKVAELLEKRRQNWQELERLCEQLQNRRKKNIPAAELSRFASLYRAACADLALADSYQLPSNTIEYLHRLVGRAHNQLYRSRSFDFASWTETLFVHVPQRIFRDACVHVAFFVFWLVFILSAVFAYANSSFPGYAEFLLDDATTTQLETNFADPLNGRDPAADFTMACFYIKHNTGIGLKCFVACIGVVPGLFTLLFNAAHLGACFGYMARPDVEAGRNFFQFVTAHGPFELTAIVLSAGAGLRIGMGWIKTNGLTRLDSLRKTAKETLPVMGAACAMFFFAALIEGFVSPSAAPYWFKASVAVLTSGLLMFYFVVLGFPRGAREL